MDLIWVHNAYGSGVYALAYEYSSRGTDTLVVEMGRWTARGGYCDQLINGYRSACSTDYQCGQAGSGGAASGCCPRQEVAFLNWSLRNFCLGGCPLDGAEEV